MLIHEFIAKLDEDDYLCSASQIDNCLFLSVDEGIAIFLHIQEDGTVREWADVDIRGIIYDEPNKIHDSLAALYEDWNTPPLAAPDADFTL